MNLTTSTINFGNVIIEKLLFGTFNSVQFSDILHAVKVAMGHI